MYILSPYACVYWLFRTSCKCIALSQVLNGGFLQTSRRGRLLIFSCYHIFLYRILEVRVDFCSHFRLLWFTPCHRVIFLVTLTLLNDQKSDQLHQRDFSYHLFSLILLTINIYMRYFVSRKSTLLCLPLL